MTDAHLLAGGAAWPAIDLLGALLRGGAAALAVAAVLVAARHWGRDLAGLLAGLPTVTGPALVCLALDRGSDFAGQAAHSAVAVAVPCALFALTYAGLAAQRGRLVAACCACAACLLALWLMTLLSIWSWPAQALLALVAISCTACLALMPRAVPTAGSRTTAAGERATVWRAGVMTALLSGAVSTCVSLSAQALGPQWAGVLASLPLLAGAVALELHRQGRPTRVQDFLRGYTAGLVGRSVFVWIFGALLVTQGLSLALSAALATSLLLGWASMAWMQWRSRLAIGRATRA